MSVPATRIGDNDVTHCSGMVRAQGSRDVFVNGIPWSLETHDNTPHLIPGGDKCYTHQAQIAQGSRVVFVNGLPSGRIGDDVGPSCTMVAQGSRNVFAGH